MREQIIQQRIRLDLGRHPDLRLFRNNVGSRLSGKEVKITRENVATFRLRVGDLVIRDGRPVPYGLAKGSSDLVGIRRITITPDMVGKTVGVFASLEVKTATGPVRPEQKAWLGMVEQFGGIASIVRSTEDAVRVLGITGNTAGRLA